MKHSQLVRSALRQMAPEADVDEVGTGETLQEAIDLESIDFLNFVVGLQEETWCEIPERNYPQPSTVEGCGAYLTSIGFVPRQSGASITMEQEERRLSCEHPLETASPVTR